jgi:DNA mismatch endonuclease (patch repair protein)
MRPEDPTYPKPGSLQISAAMRGNRKRDTRPEVALRSCLHRMGLRFRVASRVRLAELSVSPDVVFPAARVAVFVDGCFWHCCPVHGSQPRGNATYWETKLARNLERDVRVNLALRAAGWRVLRIWEHVPTAVAAKQVASALRRRHPPG